MQSRKMQRRPSNLLSRGSVASAAAACDRSLIDWRSSSGRRPGGGGRGLALPKERVPRRCARGSRSPAWWSRLSPRGLSRNVLREVQCGSPVAGTPGCHTFERRDRRDTPTGGGLRTGHLEPAWSRRGIGPVGAATCGQVHADDHRPGQHGDDSQRGSNSWRRDRH